MSRRIRQHLAAQLAAEIRRVPLSHGGPFSVALVYPNRYAVGMGNLGFHAVLATMADQGLHVERAFLPDETLLLEHRRTRTPLLTVESQSQINSFDVVCFSVAFEPDYVGVVQALELSGLAVRAAERAPQDPVVLAGGIAVTLNPEPIAEVCDALAVGEGEAALADMATWAGDVGDREALLAGLHQRAGWYVPSRPSTAVERLAALQAPPAYPAVISPDAAFGDHLDVEVSRGCRFRCRFCAAGHIVTPYREHDVTALTTALDFGLAQHKRIGLVGTDVSDHRHLEPIVRYVRDRGGRIALPSLRVERLARRSGAVARILATDPPRTLTIAVEAACDTLRRGLGKRLSDERLLQAAAHARDLGVAALRVYLLVGHPSEAWSDIEAIVPLCGALIAHGPPGQLTVSVTPVVPKAGTPLQWEAAPDRQYLRRVRSYLRKQLGNSQRLSLIFESPDWCRFQAALSLGGREMLPHLLVAAAAGWRRGLSSAEHAGLSYLCGNGRTFADPLPWGFITRADAPEVLWHERSCYRDGTYVAPTRRGPSGSRAPA